jgi:hypothetical protein
MMKRQNNTNPKARFIATLLVCSLILLSSYSLYLVNAVPQGASVTGTPSVDNGPTKLPQSRTDAGGKIITANFALQQQDNGWKAYVGNVSGTFVLQNANNKSIYEWPSITTATGELYISRNSTLNFSSINCSNSGNISVEQNYLGIITTDPDSINNTFNWTQHKAFSVGTTPIGSNTCPAVATWVNSTQQTPGASAVFQEVLLSDGQNLIYAPLLNDNQHGFDNTSTTYDFQAIVADNRSSATGTTYYFFLELGS